MLDVETNNLIESVENLNKTIALCGGGEKFTQKRNHNRPPPSTKSTP